MEERIENLLGTIDDLRQRVEAIERDFAEFRKRPLAGVSYCPDHDWGKGTTPKWERWSFVGDATGWRFTEDDFKEKS